MTLTLAPELAIEPADDPVFATDFIREMLRQTRALDTYGEWDGQPVPVILSGYVLSKEQKRAIPTIGDPDEVTLARVKAFHNAIAVLIDDSASMTRARRQLARRIAAGLAVVAGAAALPIAVAGLGAAATRGRRPVRLGPGEVAARLAPLVAAGAPSPDRSPPAAPRPDALDVALARAARWAQADDRIALVSDLADPAPVEALAGAAARLGRRAGQVVTVQLIDARDGALPADVDRLRSAERGATRAIDHALARGFAARVAAWQRDLAGAFARVGAPLVVIDVAAPPPLAALVAQVVAAWR